MKYLLTICFGFAVLFSYGQQGTRNTQLVQVSGIVTDLDSANVVPYVTITNLRDKQTYSANYTGFFSFIARPGDSLAFSAVGYTSITRVVPANMTEDRLTLMVRLKAEITMLQAVRIFPWATAEEFTRAFLALKIADDDVEIARKNLSPKSLRQMGVTLSRDAGEISSMNNRLEFDRSLNKNMVQTNPFLNPFAWGRMLQSILNGDKSRQSEN